MATLRDEIPLSIRKVVKKTFRRIVRTLAFAVVLTICFVFVYDALSDGTSQFARGLAQSQEQALALWCLAMLVWIGWEPIYQYLYFVNYFYDIDEKNLIVRKGVVVKREIILPFSKITDVYVDQDMIDVALGLYDVHISTPTQESGKFAHIDGVTKKGAVKLRQLILERINKD